MFQRVFSPVAPNSFAGESEAGTTFIIYKFPSFSGSTKPSISDGNFGIFNTLIGKNLNTVKRI